MADADGEDFEASRAALAPTLDAAADLLPWLARPAPPRFPEELNRRWCAAARQVADDCAGRHRGRDPRSALFALYAVAVDSADAGCLALLEALAGAGDRWDEPELPPRLVAALAATGEFLADPAGLEQPNFPERCRHFTQRLQQALRDGDAIRSTLIDRLFVGEAEDRLETMRDALAALPPDAYALKCEAEAVAEQAAQLELWGIMRLAREAAGLAAQIGDPDDEAALSAAAAKLDELAQALAAVDG
ncbi:MAG: hypothetical protein PHD19_14510 [Dechloromonas sp.]|uniref:hypothetical protein n=1 Tax=Azonexus sp. TaxID=1872668 RepID=UPI0035B0886B|nr:hypothetical protein [Dechloromonas sp.]